VSDLSQRDQVVLELWLRGFDDKDVAERLGVSRQTVDRTRARLCERAMVRTRFQLGSRATSLGWLQGSSPRVSPRGRTP
jgi:DNA-binding NarL/FixJ family response regulator